MKIGIDVSQIAYENTGVANYLNRLVSEIMRIDKKNDYVLFFSSLRKEFPISNFQLSNESHKRVKIKKFPFPPILLDFLWNKLHVIPIEWLIGNLDVFISSDWTEPPVIKAKKCTILYDLIVYRYPNETDKKIVETQKRKLEWTKKECDFIFCISEATKNDAIKILRIKENKLKVIFPGI